MYTSLSLLGSKNTSSALSKRGLGSQRDETTELRGSASMVPSVPAPCHVASRGRGVCSEGRRGRRLGRLSRECLPCQGLLSLRGRAEDDTVITAAAEKYISKTVTAYRISGRMKIRLHRLVGLANNVSNHACCAVWHSCTALFLCLLYLPVFFLIDIPLPLLLHCCSTGTRLLLGQASAPLPSPPLLLPSLLALSFFGIHQFSCSFPRGPMGHGYTHTHTNTEPFSAALCIHGPLDPSATRPRADGSRGGSEKLSNVTPAT